MRGEELSIKLVPIPLNDEVLADRFLGPNDPVTWSRGRGRLPYFISSMANANTRKRKRPRNVRWRLRKVHSAGTIP